MRFVQRTHTAHAQTSCLLRLFSSNVQNTDEIKENSFRSKPGQPWSCSRNLRILLVRHTATHIIMLYRSFWAVLNVVVYLL